MDKIINRDLVLGFCRYKIQRNYSRDLGIHNIPAGPNYTILDCGKKLLALDMANKLGIKYNYNSSQKEDINRSLNKLFEFNSSTIAYLLIHTEQDKLSDYVTNLEKKFCKKYDKDKEVILQLEEEYLIYRHYAICLNISIVMSGLDSSYAEELLNEGDREHLRYKTLIAAMQHSNLPKNRVEEYMLDLCIV